MNLGRMKRSETTEQIKLFNWAKSNEEFVPELKLMYHIPNEGKRNEATGKILKAAGLKSGVPDIALPVARKGFNGLYIEMKFGKNKPTKEQTEFMDLLKRAGNKVTVAYSFEQAREVVRGYLAKAQSFDLVNCEEAAKMIDLTSGKKYCEGIVSTLAPCKGCEYYKDNRREK